jgi:hypothetical protein
LLDWEEEMGATEMFYLVEGGGRRTVIYSLGQHLALSTGRTVLGRENNLCRESRRMQPAPVIRVTMTQ